MAKCKYEFQIQRFCCHIRQQWIRQNSLQDAPLSFRTKDNPNEFLAYPFLPVRVLAMSKRPPVEPGAWHCGDEAYVASEEAAFRVCLLAQQRSICARLCATKTLTSAGMMHVCTSSTRVGAATSTLHVARSATNAAWRNPRNLSWPCPTIRSGMTLPRNRRDCSRLQTGLAQSMLCLAHLL